MKKGSAPSPGSGTITAHISVRRQFRAEGEDDSDKEHSAFVASKPVPVPPRPKGSMTKGLTEYVDLTCDDEIMAGVSEATPGMESTRFTSSVFKIMSFQQVLNSFLIEYRMWSKLAKPLKDIATFLLCAPYFQPPAKSKAGAASNDGVPGTEVFLRQVDMPCSGGCKDVSREGSSARYVRVTCKACVLWVGGRDRCRCRIQRLVSTSV